MWTTLAYPAEQLSEEAAFIAYYFHWPLDEILGLEHAERRSWAEEISRLNDRVNSERSEAMVT